MPALARFSLLALLVSLPLAVSSAEPLRALGELFPPLSGSASPSFIKVIDGSSSLPGTLPSGEAGKRLLSGLSAHKRSFLVESLQLLPYTAGQKADKERVFEALRRVRGLAGITYHSSSRDKQIPLFSEATRIDSLKGKKALDDGASHRAQNERAILRLKDSNFGNCYYEARTDASFEGILYELENLKSLSYGIIDVVDEREFYISFYVEPVREGILLYALGSANVSSFVASKVNMPSATRKRLAVITEWITRGIAKQ